MKWRLVAAFVGITIVVLAAQDIPLARHLQQVERDRLVTGLERDAFVLAGRVEEALEAGSQRTDARMQSLIDEYRAQSGARVVITDRAGTAVAISDEEVSAGSDYSSRPEIAAALTGGPVAGERNSVTLGFRLLYVAVPVVNATNVVGVVRLTYPAAEIGQRVDQRLRGLLIVALISILIAAGAALVLAGTITRPIRRLRAATDRLAGGDLAASAAADEGPPEVRGLAQAFNTMSARMRRLVDDQRAFAGDASHQLRTPLTALRLRLELAARTVDTDPSGTRSSIEAAGAEAERLQHLVDGLLALARAEGSEHALVATDVAALAHERAEVWRPLAEEHGVVLSVSAPARAIVLALPGAIEQIIDNYTDNALAATPRGGAIEIEVRSVAPVSGEARTESTSTVELHVRDTGPGLTDDQLSRAFERFWRGSDSTGATSGGSGLGLAIVAQLSRVCRATATLVNQPEGGLDAAVTFADPRAASATHRAGYELT